MSWIVVIEKLAKFETKEEALEFYVKCFSDKWKDEPLIHVNTDCREVEAVGYITENCSDPVLVYLKEKE